MTRRLNDTRALTDRPLEPDSEHSVRTRKVGEGYVVCTSSFNPSTGEYRSDEQYYAQPPRIVPPRVTRSSPQSDGAGSRGLADTMSYLKEK